jgi:DNA-directed RNA polymerase subunit RPC12/RpoP
MSILIACPSCGARLNVSDNAAGKTVQCLKCSARIVIPPPPAPSPPQADPPPAAATTPKQQISDRLRQYEEEKNQEEYEAPVRTPDRPRGHSEETDPEYESDEEYHEVSARKRRPQQQSNWMAITGMIMGLTSIGIGCLRCGWSLGFLLSILGIIFSGMGLAQARQVKTKPQPGKKMAIAGLVTSILALVILPISPFLLLIVLLLIGCFPPIGN